LANLSFFLFAIQQKLWRGNLSRRFRQDKSAELAKSPQNGRPRKQKCATTPEIGLLYAPSWVVLAPPAIIAALLANLTHHYPWFPAPRP
jgi:hypothetical protein